MHTRTLVWALAASASLLAVGCGPRAKPRPDAAAGAPPSAEAPDTGTTEGAAAGGGGHRDEGAEDDWVDGDLPAADDSAPATAVGSGDTTGAPLSSVWTAAGALACEAELLVDGLESACAGRDFAFDLCCAKSTPEERQALDLSCWKVALNGAEPIRFETEQTFVELFRESGVSWATLSHAYGMSEATACISKEAVGTPRVWLDVDDAALAQHRVVRAAAGAAGGSEGESDSL